VAYQLAVRLAELSFDRGLPGEAQDRYEQAAELAAGDRDAAAALRGAAAAADLARAAELVTRLPGLWDTPPDVTAAGQLIAEARALGSDSPAAEARIL